MTRVRNIFDFIYSRMSDETKVRAFLLLVVLISGLIGALSVRLLGC
jgi:hypothetical protein